MTDTGPITRRDLVEQNVEKVINKEKAAGIMVSADLGGTGFSNMLEVIESAKMMAMAGPMIPAWLRGNPGGCWGVILQAIEWKFSPLSVARMSFEVNGNIAYMSQLVHAVIEARAPLQGRLRCDYEGENGERVCIVTGLFKGDDESQVYRSPKIGSIKPKNSPLWVNDPDQQLWYFASRAWCRRFAPDVLLGVYSKDELLDNPAIAEASDAARDVSPGLHARLAGTERGEEGHQPGHVASELDQIAAETKTEILPPEQQSDKNTDKVGKPPKSKKKDTAPPQTPVTEQPKSGIEYIAFAERWIDSTTSADNAWARWDGEREMRDELQVQMKDRKSLEAEINRRFPKD